MHPPLYLLLLTLLPALTLAIEPISVKHYQQQARYSVGNKLLHLALSKISKPYNIHTPKSQRVNEGRGEFQVMSGELDVQWMSSTAIRELKMIPIKFPLYRGILGLRLMLVHEDNFDAISKIKTLDELQHYTGGHGTLWGDLPVYKANKLTVTTHVSYETLFRQLQDKRFDYFHRGLSEIWAEQRRYKNTLRVADNIMLYYPQPIYFFVTVYRPQLAKDIKLGLERALADGSYKALFLKSFQGHLAQANLEKRRLIQLTNPSLPNNSPSIDTSWWLPKKFNIL
jgi:hypothetical protein